VRLQQQRLPERKGAVAAVARCLSEGGWTRRVIEYLYIRRMVRAVAAVSYKYSITSPRELAV